MISCLSISLHSTTRSLSTLLARCGPLDTKNEVIVTVTVELIDRALSVFAVNHVNKRKPTRLPGVTVDSNVNSCNWPERSEQFLQVLLARVL